ncbi:P-loop containing nucleoside triphosphate hydrolases superfamily protein [Wolffia australiana]
MELLISQTHRSMLRFLTKQSCIQSKVFSARTSKLHSTVALLSQARSENSTLTLSSVGFGEERRKSEIIEKKPPKKIRGSTEKRPLDEETAPFSAKSFSELGLSPQLIKRLQEENFVVPTDIQSAVIPVISKKHDVVIQSYTGSGKTLAYLLPLLSKVGPFRHSTLVEQQLENKPGIEAVIVAPSRELGMQIVRQVEQILGPNNKRFVQQLVGGANRSRQEEALKKNKPGIVVGTPGRIAEISAAGKLHTHDCHYLVLDEVDQLLAFNFREDMHRILDHVGRRSSGRQLVMVSATVPTPVMRCAKTWGQDPLLVNAGEVKAIDLASGPVVEAVKDSLPPSLEHFYCLVRGQHKVDTLRRCIHAVDARSVIVFLNHARQIKDVVFKLQARGIKAAELHGDLGKLARSTTMKQFKEGELRVLVTNELSARGLDVADCDLVVNLDLPTDSVHYAHRAGRAGRLGRKGRVVTIVEGSEAFVIKKMQRQVGCTISRCEVAEGKLVVANDELKKSESVR